MPKGSILVVDDELEIREGLEALLKSEDFEVDLAETGEAGLQKLEQRPYDVVLLDVSLPDGNGVDLIPEIHRRGVHSPRRLSFVAPLTGARLAFALRRVSLSR